MLTPTFDNGAAPLLARARTRVRPYRSTSRNAAARTDGMASSSTGLPVPDGEGGDADELALEVRASAPAVCSAQDRRAEVFRDRVHDHEVRRPAPTDHRAAADADAAKARALVRGQPRDV